MFAIPTDLYKPCRDILCRCQEFRSYQNLRAVFVTEQLLPFRIGLQSADSPEELVDLCLDYLLAKHLRDGRSVLLLFISTLRDRYDPSDALHSNLNDLYSLLQSASTQGTPQIESVPRRKQMLFDRLLQLNFRPQVRMVKDVIEEYQVAAFLINGPPEHGQRLLAYRLAHLKPEWETGQHIVIDAGSNGIGKSSRALWHQIAKKLQLSTWTSTDVATKVCEWWKTQDVIFTFHTVDYMLPNLLSAWLEEFWGLLVSATHTIQSTTRRRTHLILFLVDYNGDVPNWNVTLARQPKDLQIAPVPLLLPAIEPFQELELEIWIDGAAEVLPVGLSAQTLVAPPYKGIPENVYDKICQHCGINWEGEVAR